MNTEVDERTKITQSQIDATSYKVLNWGLAAIMLYRFFVLKQSLFANWDIFLLALVQGYVQIFLKYAKGIRPTKKQRTIRWILFAVIIAAMLAAMLYISFSYGFHLGMFTILSRVAMPVFTVLFFLLILWLGQLLYRRWERHNLEGSENDE